MMHPRAPQRPGRTRRPRRNPRRPAGLLGAPPGRRLGDYLHSAVDGFSGPAHTEALPDERADRRSDRGPPPRPGLLRRPQHRPHPVIVTGNGAGYRRPRANRPKAARLVEMFADDGGLLVRGLQGG
jgi:hypothetical protein